MSYQSGTCRRPMDQLPYLRTYLEGDLVIVPQHLTRNDRIVFNARKIVTPWSDAILEVVRSEDLDEWDSLSVPIVLTSGDRYTPEIATEGTFLGIRVAQAETLEEGTFPLVQLKYKIRQNITSNVRGF